MQEPRKRRSSLRNGVAVKERQRLSLDIHPEAIEDVEWYGMCQALIIRTSRRCLVLNELGILVFSHVLHRMQ